MDQQQLIDDVRLHPVSQDVSTILGEIWWLFLILVLFMVFKETIKSFVNSIMVLRSGDYNLDEIIILEGEAARIVRMGLWKTVFYVYKTNENKMFPVIREVMNEELPGLKIETPLERIDSKISDDDLVASRRVQS